MSAGTPEPGLMESPPLARPTSIPEQVVDAASASVDTAQHLARLATEVPPKGEAVEVPEELDLDFAAGELLHADPQESAHVANEARGA